MRFHCTDRSLRARNLANSHDLLGLKSHLCERHDLADSHLIIGLASTIMSKRLNKRQQREAEELAELQRAQTLAKAEQDDNVEEDVEANEAEQEDESEEEQESETKPTGKVLNPFAAVSFRMSREPGTRN